MTIDLTEHEAKEVILVLRHVFDVSMEHLPRSLSATHAYVSVISKLQAGLGMEGVSPWDKPEAFDDSRRFGKRS